jgi:2-dehydro-3-deoxygluconokinase
MTGRVVTFGELMLRLKPPGFERYLQTPGFEATFGGGEANVAFSLARFGVPVSFVTVLPKNPVADAAITFLRGAGIDTAHIVRGGERMGIYYLEAGANQRPSMVVYDRAHSSIMDASPNEIDWPAALAGSAWFHVTGITPALSASVKSRKSIALGIEVSAYQTWVTPSGGPSGNARRIASSIIHSFMRAMSSFSTRSTVILPAA